MNTPLPLLAWARSPVAPRGGAFAAREAHEIAAPVLRALLARAGVAPASVQALVMGNALGAGGNPARLSALAAGLGDGCAAFSVDSQCCAGLDAVALARGLIDSGQAELVIAGGAEAWSRAPLRARRPRDPADAPQFYDRPAFAPDQARDPDPLVAAARHAAQRSHGRGAQDSWVETSHARALAAAASPSGEIVPLAGLTVDAYPRALSAARLARMPVLRAARDAAGRDCAISLPAVSPEADGAAFVLLASDAACARLGLRPAARLLANVSCGAEPAMPLDAAAAAARRLLDRSGQGAVDTLAAVELHDAFATQALGFLVDLGLAPERLNRGGGGLARGHPIGASGAVALVRLLATLAGAGGGRGLAAIAAAGGLGSAVLVELDAAG